MNIAVYLLSDALNDNFDRAVIVSGDTDLIPVIEAVHRNTPDKEVGVIFPLRRFKNSLQEVADFSSTIKEKDLKQCQFPDEIHIGSLVLRKPRFQWKS